MRFNLDSLFSKKNIHIGFSIGLILKAFYDVGEVLSGVLLFFMTPTRMSKLITLISRNELQEDPKDLVMNYLVSFSHHFSIDMQHFSTFYLLSHGLTKVVILILLWRKKLWAYPLSIVLISIFIILQTERFTKTHSITLMIFTLIDIIMIGLTVFEYKNIKAEKTIKTL
jgi:Predicted membrane protein